MVQFEKILT